LGSADSAQGVARVPGVGIRPVAGLITVQVVAVSLSPEGQLLIGRIVSGGRNGLRQKRSRKTAAHTGAFAVRIVLISERSNKIAAALVREAGQVRNEVVPPTVQLAAGTQSS